jgi:hypothetical protein
MQSMSWSRLCRRATECRSSHRTVICLQANLCIQVSHGRMSPP